MSTAAERELEFWLTRTPATGWMRQAACRDRGELPWTQDSIALPDRKREAARMRAVCHSCPVREACAAFAVEADVNGGFWAGRWRSWRQVQHRHLHRHGEQAGTDAA